MRFTVIISMLGLLMSSAWAQCDPGELKIRIGVFNEKTDQPRMRAIDRLQRAMNIELGGRACLDVLKDQSKFSGTSAIVALQSGETDLIAPRYSELGQFIPAYRIYSLPFVFRNASHVDRFDMASAKNFDALLTSQGLRPLTRWKSGTNQIVAKAPLYQPSNIAGQRLRFDRTPGFSRFVSALNATQQKVADDQLAEAIKNQRVTAVVSRWDIMQSAKTASLLGGVTETNHSFIGYHLLTSMEWWAKLDPALRKTFSEIVTRLSRESNFDAAARSSNAKADIMRSDIPVRTLTDKQRKAWRLAVDDIWSGFAALRSGSALFKVAEQTEVGF